VRDPPAILLVEFLLGGSIVPLLMLKNLHVAEAHIDDRERFQARYAQESAVETVVAHIFFNSSRSSLRGCQRRRPIDLAIAY